MSKDNYNSLTMLPMMAYNIVNFLMFNNEDIWKILQYLGTDCLSQPNLTQIQKGKLIYDGKNPLSNGYRLFLSSSLDDTFDDVCSIIRIYPDFILPFDRVKASITFRFDIFSHVKSQSLDGYMNKNVYLLQQIVATLNGASVGGVGVLNYDRQGNSMNRANYNVSNAKNFSGFSLFMSTTTT